VRISEGYALGPFGDEIYVGEPVFLDVGKCGPNDKTDPCNPGRASGTGFTGGTVYVAIEYAECFSQPIRSLGAGCGCDDDGCEYARIRDSFDLGCLASIPAYDPPVSICDLQRTGKTAPCPSCPSSPWVVLAKVDLPSVAVSGTLSVNTGSLVADNSVRKPLYRTELLQAQLITCCCGDTKPNPILFPFVPVQVSTTGLAPAQNATVASPLTTITIPFTKSLQAPVNANSVVLSFTGKPIPVPLTYTDATHTITLTPPSGAAFAAGTYKLTVFGTGSTPIKDTDNLALDGNADGTGGDDFTSTFTIAAPSNPTVGIVSTPTNPVIPPAPSSTPSTPAPSVPR
jgi:hypothetical protein